MSEIAAILASPEYFPFAKAAIALLATTLALVIFAIVVRP